MVVNPKNIEQKLSNMWALETSFGMERSPHYIYLEEIVTDRRILTKGYQVLRDELDFAPDPKGADFSLPSVIVTLAHTICGDRACGGQPKADYNSDIGTRFANIGKTGDIKIEEFSPAGGGTEDGRTLAHVTVAHAADKYILERLHNSNPDSFTLYSFDLQTHVGKLDNNGSISFGRVRESEYREPRGACGAIVGALTAYDSGNTDHKRIRDDLGEANFDYLSSNKIFAQSGEDITYVVAAAIVAVTGMYTTIQGLTNEMGEKGLSHLTASMILNRTSLDDTVMLLSRAAIHNGTIQIQGFGTESNKYSGRMQEHHGDKRLVLVYDGNELANFPIQTSNYYKQSRAKQH